MTYCDYYIIKWVRYNSSPKTEGLLDWFQISKFQNLNMSCLEQESTTWFCQPKILSFWEHSSSGSKTNTFGSYFSRKDCYFANCLLHVALTLRSVEINYALVANSNPSRTFYFIFNFNCLHGHVEPEFWIRIIFVQTY